MMSSGLKSALPDIENARELSPAPPEVKDEITRLCAYYLLRAKRWQAPLDPVARFHLANGARLERLNWLGDMSNSGVRLSLGMTANYVYRIADVEENHEAYAENFQVVASHDLERLAKGVPAREPKAQAKP